MRRDPRYRLWLALTLSALGTASACAEPGHPDQPVKKSRDGICYPPKDSNYSRVKDFTPFIKMTDCLKSGGQLPKR